MTKEQYENFTVSELRLILAELGGAPGNKKKAVLIEEIVKIMDGEILPVRSTRGRKSSKDRRSEIIRDKDLISVDDYEGSLCDYAKETPVKGILEITIEGGYLKGVDYLATKRDVKVSPALVRDGFLIDGDLVEGVAEKEIASNQIVLKKITSVNGRDKRQAKPVRYEDIPLAPVKDVITLDDGENVTLKAIDVLSPVAVGQRGVIISPKSTYKTQLIKDVAQSLSAKSDLKTILLLIDQRPEDLMAINSASFNLEVAATTFDQSPKDHIAVAKTALERAKSLACDGENVVLLFDSATKLAKAYYRDAIASGNQQAQAKQSSILKLKQYLSVARCLQTGSIAMLAFADVSDNVLEDKALSEELKQISNMQLTLSQTLAQKRVTPPISIAETNSEYQDQLLNEKDLTLSDVINQIVAIDPDKQEEVLRVFNKYAFDERLIDKILEIKDT